MNWSNFDHIMRDKSNFHDFCHALKTKFPHCEFVSLPTFGKETNLQPEPWRRCPTATGTRRPGWCWPGSCWRPPTADTGRPWWRPGGQWCWCGGRQQEQQCWRNCSSWTELGADLDNKLKVFDQDSFLNNTELGSETFLQLKPVFPISSLQI